MIFDLDQTLVDILPIHNKALEKAFRDIFKAHAKFEEVDFAGKEVRKIMEELAKLHHIKPKEINEKKINEVITRYRNYFKKYVPRNINKYVLPGVRDLLKELYTDHFIAVMTGSAHNIPETILQKAGLSKYISMIICGTQARTKEEMIQRIIVEAKSKTKKQFNGKDIFVIGDATRDIAAGKLYGAFTVAVNTGPHTKEQLKKAKPDLYLDTLKEYDKLLKVVNAK